MPLSFTTFALPLNDKSFLWVLQLSLEKLKTALMPNLVGGGGGGGGNGANKVYVTCISGIFAKVASVLLILEELYLQDLKKLLC